MTNRQKSRNEGAGPVGAGRLQAGRQQQGVNSAMGYVGHHLIGAASQSSGLAVRAGMTSRSRRDVGGGAEVPEGGTFIGQSMTSNASPEYSALDTLSMRKGVDHYRSHR